MKALKREAKILKKGDSKVTSRQKDRHKMGLGKRGFWTALNSLTGEEIFQKTRLSPGGTDYIYNTNFNIECGISFQIVQ